MPVTIRAASAYYEPHPRPTLCHNELTVLVYSPLSHISSINGNKLSGGGAAMQVRRIELSCARDAEALLFGIRPKL